MSKSPKNDNLDKYRQKQQVINEELVKRAIEHIKKLDGIINFSLVSKVTYDIADSQKGETGLTLGGISTSKIYRSMVENAQVSSSKTSSTINKVSLGDMQMSYHGLRIQVAKLKMENKVLSQSLKESHPHKKEMGNIQEDVIKQYEEMKQISASLVSRLLELELTYIDVTKLTLNVIGYDEIIVSYEAMKLFYQKELDALQY